MRTYPVTEVFGPTIQGEGAMAGLPTHFVRFGGCDFKCVWCDSPHAVLPKFVREAVRLSVDGILYRLEGLQGNPTWVTLSGGNPLLHDLEDLVRGIQTQLHKKVAVETQGSIWKPWLERCDLVTMSPKPPSSGNPQSGEDIKNFLTLCNTYKTVLKVVVFDEEDYQYASAVHKEFSEFPFYISCGTASGGLRMDGPTDNAAGLGNRYRWVAERVAGDETMADCCVLPQLHFFAWGSERGR